MRPSVSPHWVALFISFHCKFTDVSANVLSVTEKSREILFSLTTYYNPKVEVLVSSWLTPKGGMMFLEVDSSYIRKISVTNDSFHTQAEVGLITNIPW